jgi:hypothetical protein
LGAPSLFIESYPEISGKLSEEKLAVIAKEVVSQPSVLTV